MLEFLAPGFLYSLTKDGLAALRGRKRRLTPSETVAKRERWRAEIDEKLWERRKKKQETDIIIHDVKRINQYPDIESSKKGISAWFKGGLMGTYHRGILVGLRWEMLTADGDERWRYTNYTAGEMGDIKVILIGYVRYENIEAVNWDGDEYYSEPHIYCHFDANRRGEPYEKLAFCEKRELNEVPFYTEVCTYELVRKRSKKLRIR